MYIRCCSVILKRLRVNHVRVQNRTLAARLPQCLYQPRFWGQNKLTRLETNSVLKKNQQNIRKLALLHVYVNTKTIYAAQSKFVQCVRRWTVWPPNTHRPVQRRRDKTNMMTVSFYA